MRSLLFLPRIALIALFVSLPSVALAQSTGAALTDRAADRIVRAALIRDAAMTGGLDATDAHARHDDERLAVSVARAVVFSVRNLRGQASYEADLKSAADHANRNVKRGLDMLAGGGSGDFLTNIVEGASALQELRNLDAEAEEFELKLNQQFGADDVRDIKTVLRSLPSAQDDAFVKARRAVRTALERRVDLLEPFAKEVPASSALVASRQRVSAMLAPLR